MKEFITIMANYWPITIAALADYWPKALVFVGLVVFLLLLLVTRIYILKSPKYLFWARIITLFLVAVGSVATSLISVDGAIGIVITGVFGIRQLGISQENQFFRRLRDAEKSLGHDSPTSKRFGIREFEKLSKSVHADLGGCESICATLNDFVRERAVPPRDNKGHLLPNIPPDDWGSIKLAIRVLGAIAPDKDDMREINLTDLHLRGVNLEKINLAKANLRGANLHEAKLSNANLSGAKLQNTNLQFATLESADFQDAELERADVTGAKLQGAKNLESKQLAQVICQRKYLLFSLGQEFTIPAHRAYEWGMNNGGLCRCFTKSSDPVSETWIDHRPPQWPQPLS